MRILIVEDEQRARKGLFKLITSIGDEFEIIGEAPDGRKALEIIKSTKPDVVFTDIRMPYMDGMALIKAVESFEIKTKFVILSAYEDFDIARQAISMGVTEYLVKPVTYQEVEDILMRLQSSAGKKIEVRKDLQLSYPDAHPLVLKALTMIEVSYGTKISQEELAENLGITQEYFSYLFRRDVGENFSKFLKKYRIDVAKTMILNEAVPKEDIPYSVGFSDPKYFNKIFREIAGESVAEFIRNNK
ncbi:response regulator transcription factor [Anaerobium acetethylicum]|uniref:Stage 0 sporulation protein A homolog n=1 Tax=Anaerobium acetethylicum TaxID=1619234 RepID=A0A1D3TW38_9FIRM|nr:response regulator [Anaerobium acetethylicum]SCP98383.1 two-component system, response regulator YesN [Anaerobium acetethylicum]